MNRLVTLSLILFLALIAFKAENSGAKTGTDDMTTKEAGKSAQAGPDALRSACAFLWNRHYKKEKAQIVVTTRGTYDETIVFTCPDCSLEQHFVEPFLNSEYQGKTGMDRIKACGYTEVVFKGARGLEEIVRQVP